MDDDLEKGMQEISRGLDETDSMKRIQAMLKKNIPPQPAPMENIPIKIDHTFLPLDALDEVSRSLMHGEEKYSAKRWVTHPHRHRDLLAKALRHIFAFQRGETVDSSGLQHIACAICDLMFLQSNVLRGTGTDDRIIYPEKKEE
jgi:hypothetical protein